MNLNKVFLQGRVTAVPELRKTQSNKSVCTFTLAVDWGEQADFIDCVAWEKTAEFLNNYFTKGQEMLLVGRLSKRSYDKDGQKRFVTEVIVEQVYFCGSKNAARDRDGNERRPTVQEQQVFHAIMDEEAGELPF